MAVAIKVPSVGESITEGAIARWLKKDGDIVRADEPLFELETDKATTAVPSPAAGTLRITAPEGETVAIGAVVGQIEPAAKVAPVAADDQRQRPASAAKEADERRQRPAPAAKEADAPQREMLMAPSARRLADDKGVDAGQIEGTGRGGRITKEDVVAYLEQHPASEAPSTPQPPAPPKTEPAPSPERQTRQRMSAIRQRIAERLVASQRSTATLTTFNEADLSAVMALRARYKDKFQQKHDVSLGFMSFFVKACVEALRAFPVVNARIDGSDVVYQHDCNIGVAVSTDKGLMVPVLRDAGRMSFAGIEKAVAELAKKAREGTVAPSDFQGGTFTITNGGIFGSLLSTPILNPPQSAILGMHAIQKRPVAVDEQIVIRPMMYLALSYDHRLIDGREAVLFLVRVKECIEAPERLLLEI